MTYPNPRYHGPGGEISAWRRSASEEPDLILRDTVRVHYLATGAGTDGLFGLYRWEMDPEPGGAEPHFHRTMSESFYVLSGTVEIFDGREWVPSGPGDFVHVPPGGVHGFRNGSGAPVAMLIHFAPGAPREAYFEGLREISEMSAEDRDAFLVRHDNLLTG